MQIARAEADTAFTNGPEPFEPKPPNELRPLSVVEVDITQTQVATHGNQRARRFTSTIAVHARLQSSPPPRGAEAIFDIFASDSLNFGLLGEHRVRR